MAGERDFYAILGLPRSASQSDIKKAYRKLALKWHPDKNQSPEAVAKFQDISQAYDILSDETKKPVYDQYGEAGLNPSAAPTGGHGFGHAGGGFGGSSNFSQSDADRIFRQFFGGGSGGGGGRVSGPSMFSFFGGGGGSSGGNPFGGGDGSSDDDGDIGMAGSSPFGGGFPGHAQHQRYAAPLRRATVKRALPCTLEELYSGFHKKLKVTKNLQDSQTGQLVQASSILEVTGRPGWKAGTKVTFPAAGDEIVGHPPQDIQFIVEEKPHPVFKRDNSDLLATISVPLVTALCGGAATVRGIDSKEVFVSIPAGTKAGTTLRVSGHGMPTKDGSRGALCLTVDVVYPSLSDNQKKQLHDVLQPSGA